MIPTRKEIDKAVAFLREIPRTPPDNEMCGTTAWFTLACDWLYCNDRTPLTVEHLRENGFESDNNREFVLHENRGILWVHIHGPAEAWGWISGGCVLPRWFRPTTLGELRQLIRKLEGGGE